MISAYNTISTAKIDIDVDTPINNRAKLDTGTFCNYDCGFCYYKTKLHEKTSFDIIKERINYLIECGITEVDLSGGESSVHENWFDILDYCKSYNLNISCLSNGFKFAKKDFLRKSKEHGLSEILFSVHGYNEQSHDMLVGRNKAYQHMMKAIYNAKELGIIVRINCTITNDNYKHLNSFVQKILEIKPTQVNFLPLNYWEDADRLDTIDYTEVTPYIHEAIDQLTEIKEVNVRYIPFCFMKGYEQHVIDYYQHIYDQRDWNIALYDYNMNPTTYKNNKHKLMFMVAQKNRVNTYYKTKECTNCKHFYICDGIEKQIKNVSVVPEEGHRITDVNYYRKRYVK